MIDRDEFKQMEARAPSWQRLERVDGYVYAMAGAGLAHERVVARVLRLVGDAADAHGCEAFGSNRRLSIENHSDMLPDVSAYCDPDDRDEYAGRRPCLIVEVLSKSTALDDLNLKLPRYKQVPSIETILFLNPEPLYAEVFTRLGEQWTQTLLAQDGDLIRLSCPPCTIPLAAFAFPPAGFA